MEKAKVMSIKLDGVTINVSDMYVTDLCFMLVTGIKGSMVQFLAMEEIDNKYYDFDLPVTYCDAKALLNYKLVYRAGQWKL